MSQNDRKATIAGITLLSAALVIVGGGTIGSAVGAAKLGKQGNLEGRLGLILLSIFLGVSGLILGSMLVSQIVTFRKL